MNQTGQPAVLTYLPSVSDEAWQVRAWPELVAEFEIGAEQMPAFDSHCRQFARQWTIICYLFGIGPQIPPMNASMDGLGAHTRRMACEKFGLEPKKLTEELGALRANWSAKQGLSGMGGAEASDPEGAAAAAKATKASAPGNQTDLLGLAGGENGPIGRALEAEPLGALELTREDLLSREKLLEEFDFVEGTFDFQWEERVGDQVVTRKRDPAERRMERNWFINRLHELARMFREPRSASLARQVITNELWLRRYEILMTGLKPTSDAATILDKRRQNAQETLQKLLQELDEMFPDLGLKSKLKLHGVLSDVQQAMMDYYGRDDNRLLNYLGTAAEIEVMLRMSEQAPSPQFRFDVAVLAQEAAAALFDPKWRSKLKSGVLSKLRKGFMGAVTLVRETSGEPLLDLEDEASWPEEPGLKKG